MKRLFALSVLLALALVSLPSIAWIRSPATSFATLPAGAVISQNPVAAISTYLWAVVDEARVRGYTFDASKIAMRRRAILIPVTRRQLEFEREHLRKKLGLRDQRSARVVSTAKLRPHPMLRLVAGDIEPWETVKRRPSAAEKSQLKTEAQTLPLHGSSLCGVALV